MTREENFEQYILRKATMFNNLLANAHSLHPDDLANSIIDGLPAEFAVGRTSLYAPCSGAATDTIRRILRARAHGLGFNDLRPRPAPKATAATIPSKAGDKGNSRPARRPRFLECCKHGHIARDCKKWYEETKGDTCKSKRTPPAPIPATSSAPVPTVSLNVLAPETSGHNIESWLVDSGASVHLVNDSSMLHNATLYTEPRVLQLATSESHGQIVASGSVCLLNNEGRGLWLHNVQCVPQARHQTCSLSLQPYGMVHHL